MADMDVFFLCDQEDHVHLFDKQDVRCPRCGSLKANCATQSTLSIKRTLSQELTSPITAMKCLDWLKAHKFLLLPTHWLISTLQSISTRLLSTRNFIGALGWTTLTWTEMVLRSSIWMAFARAVLTVCNLRVLTYSLAVGNLYFGINASIESKTVECYVTIVANFSLPKIEPLEEILVISSFKFGVTTCHCGWQSQNLSVSQ